MTVFAIKQLSTGYYLPLRNRRRGFTYDEPEPDCIPRQFADKRTASRALRAWLDGPWEPEYEYNEWTGNYMKVGAGPNRHRVRAHLKGDMVVVPMTLTEWA